jgi:UDPglucose 6-dehydrogenase
VPSAEMTKYAANAMLATRISFMNEIANLCELVGADVNRVREGIGSDARIGHSFLFAGLGYGGSCFPKDVQAIIRTAAERDYRFRVLEAVEEVNERQKKKIVSWVKQHFGERLEGRTFALWGLSFKPRTDDMREAPSVTVIEELLAAGAKIRATDPEAIKEARKVFGDKIEYHQRPYDTLQDADAMIVITEWNEFRRPNFEKMRALMKTPIIFDGRNIYSPKTLEKEGFTYFAIGCAPVRQK